MSTGGMMLTCDVVRSGLGIGLVPEFLVHVGLAKGDLVRRLPGEALPRSAATALFARSRVPSLALRTLLDHLADPSATTAPIEREGLGRAAF